MMTHLVNPEKDTRCFRLAVEEWKRENDCPLAAYNDLPLAARSAIMRRAQELKTQPDIMGTRGIPLNQEILPGVREIDWEEFRHGDL